MKITTIIGWIKSLVQKRTYQSSVEHYVTSKNPTTAAEVDYWIREYNTNTKAWSL